MTNRTAVVPVLPAWIEHTAQNEICEDCGRQHVGSDITTVWFRGATVDEPKPTADRPEVDLIFHCPVCRANAFAKVDVALDEMIEAIVAVYARRARELTQKGKPFLSLAG